MYKYYFLYAPSFNFTSPITIAAAFDHTVYSELNAITITIGLKKNYLLTMRELREVIHSINSVFEVRGERFLMK